MTVISSFLQQKRDLFPNSITNFELDGFSIGYVIATSELADSQASPFSPTRTTLSLVASQSLMSLRPLNRQIAKPHLSVRQGLLLSLVASQPVTSLRPLNRQIAKSHLLVRQGLSRAWWLLNQLRHCDL